MTLDPVDASAVTQALEEEGLKVDADETNLFWALRLEVYARPQTAILLLPPQGEYFVAMSPVSSPALSKPIEELPATTLSTIIKLQSDEMLAKKQRARPTSVGRRPAPGLRERVGGKSASALDRLLGHCLPAPLFALFLDLARGLFQ